jgi:serine/threonine-protein kinase RsbW
MAENLDAELVVSNETANLASVREFVLTNLRKTKIPEGEHGKIVLAVDEGISNIIRHAYDEFAKGSRTIEVQFRADEEKVVLVLKDSGKEFDPSGIEAPNILEHVKLGKRYGLGLFLMRRIMDEVKFVFRSGIENMLTMVKYIHAQDTQPGTREQKKDTQANNS